MKIEKHILWQTQGNHKNRPIENMEELSTKNRTLDHSIPLIAYHVMSILGTDYGSTGRTPDIKGFIVAGGATIRLAGMHPTSEGPPKTVHYNLNVTCIRYISRRPLTTAPHVTAINCHYRTFYVWKGRNSLLILKFNLGSQVYLGSRQAITSFSYIKCTVVTVYSCYMWGCS